MNGLDAVNTSLLRDIAPPAARGARDDSSLGAFDAIVNRLSDAPGAVERAAVESTLREAAENLVSSAFITPVLAALRSSNQAAEPFAPGTAERRFGPLLDQHIADSIVKGGNFGLVDSIVERFMPAEQRMHGVEVTA